jgi:hypothetical protein
MITVLTSHNKIWEPEKLVAELILAYQTTGSVLINLSNEGPCADSIGLYKILDMVCEKFKFDPAKIIIQTCNFEELHTTYQIEKHAQPWVRPTIAAFHNKNLKIKKSDNLKLFGCIYNVPSWDRLCLLSYISRKTDNSAILHVNGVWEGSKYNSYYLDSVTDFCPDEFFNIAEFLKLPIGSALKDITDGKPTTAEKMLNVLPLYNNFLVDVVAETYSHGRCFFITEKTIRPILAMTPFIIHGPRGYLSTLKSDYGFKTFDQWWDEDYDNYENYERITKIYHVIDSLIQMPQQNLNDLYNDMLPTLTHNYKILHGYKQQR